MKIVHWAAFQGSGMYGVAASISEAERQRGLDSNLVDLHTSTPEMWDEWVDADVHVAHTHFPTEIKQRLTRPLKLTWVSHGVPELVFYAAMQEAKKGYGAGDGWMLLMHWLRVADARVTFWPRHKWIMDSMVDNGTKVHLVDLGINREFWGKGVSRGKFGGSPSVFTAENCHEIKAPLDLFLMWPEVYNAIPGACLHACYLPNDQHRWWFPLLNRNGCSYGAHVSSFTFPQTELRNVFKSVDWFIGLVAKGDFNRLSLEATVAGLPTISYKGNPYSSYWIEEGDQRIQSEQLIAILKNETEPRKDRKEVPDISTTAEQMLKVYESIL